MNIIPKNISAWLNKTSKSNNEPVETKKKRISHKITRNYHYRINLDLDALKIAVDAARDPDHPKREELYTIYDLIATDSHLASQLRTAKYAVQQSEFFLVDAKGNEVKDKSELLKTKWFDTFISLALDAEFYGHSLIEFSQLVNGVFEDTELIPRLNVIPEQGIVIMNLYDTKGIDYRNNATRLGLIEVGGHYNLGLLELAAKEVIVKNYARSDWSQASEKYGSPMLKIKTDTEDPKELDRMETSAANFSTSGYIILGMDDDAEIIAPKSSDFYKIYMENAKMCDAQLSKLINGQTMTSDDGSSYSQAEVHERILNDYTLARLRRMRFLVNKQLIPFLVYWGYPIEGLKLQYRDLIPKDPSMKSTAEKEEEEKKKEEAEKKKLIAQLPDWVLNM
jgi:phage gp29-like protein